MLRHHALSENLSRVAETRKAVARSAGGVVAAHHRVAAQAGVQVLRDGGNAVDAAIATGFAAGVAEPWMSGIGGIGVMLVREAQSGRISVIDFGARSPQGLDPADFPMIGGADSDLFGWPMVVENRNVVGAKAIAVPAMVAGHALAHERFGSKPWADLVMPAAEIAQAGVDVDWYATLIIAGAMSDLLRDPGCAEHFLRAGAPVAQGAASAGAPPRMPWPALARTLRSIAQDGPATFYTGAVARALIGDIAALGGYLSMDDLAAVRAQACEPATLRYREYDIAVAPELNGGPTMIEAMATLQDDHKPTGTAPDAAMFSAIASALKKAWTRRLAEMGDRTPHPSSTTNFSVVDGEGNIVVCTQTLLSLFGARVLSPETGILMNNGINWFDPRPDAVNTIGPGKRVLANYCPAIAVGDDDVIGLGGSGGRKIIPAMMNLLCFMIDHGMSLEEAMHHPRIDVSGPDNVVADARLPAALLGELAGHHDVTLAERLPYPNNFTTASVVRREAGVNEGGAEPVQPTAEAIGV
ncbi:MAG: gamma-glutamyltransferase [Salinarimonas sp.]|nr:gamma-glutamyltransferase [Salinarimonas sp.]